MPSPRPPAISNPVARLIRIVLAVAVFLVVLLIDPYTPLPTIDIKWLVVTWTGLITGTLWLLSPVFTRDPMRWPRLFGPLAAALLAFLLLGSLFSPHLWLNLHETRKFLSLVLIMGAAAYAYRTVPQVRVLLVAMCTAVALSSIYGFLQRAGIDPFPWDPAQLDSDEYRNVPGTFGNPNYAAHAMVLTVVFALYLALGAGWRWAWAFLPIFATHFYLTEQRGGLVALGVAAVLFGFARFGGRITQRPVLRVSGTLLLTGLAVMGGALAVMGYLRATTGTPYPLDIALLIRYQAYVSATEMILDRPVLGYGTGSYPVENPPYWTDFEQRFFAQENQVNEHVHCDPLELAVDGGIPAAASYLILMTLAIAYGLFWAFTRPDRREGLLGLALACGFAGFLVDGLFGFNLRVPVTALFLFALLGVLEGIWRQVRETTAPEARAGAEEAGATRWVLAARWGAVAVALVATGFDTRYFLAMRLLQEGRAWAVVDQFDLAHDRKQVAASWVPWDWNIAREQAQTSLFEGDALSAAEHLDRAVSLRPHSVFLLAEAARVKLAVATELADSLGPPSAQKSAALEAALQEPQRLAEAAIALCPYYPLAHEVAGRVHAMLASDLEQRGDALAPDERRQLVNAWPQAARHFGLALQHGGANRQELYHQIAVARIGMRDDDAAQEALDRALAERPAGPYNWGLYLRFARYADRFEPMAAALERAADHLLENPDAPPARLAEVYTYRALVASEGMGDVEEAEGFFQRAAQAAPSDGGVWRAYAEFAARFGRLAPMQAFVRGLWAERETLGDGVPPHIAALALAWEEDDPAAFARGAAFFSRFLLEQPGEQVHPRIVQEVSWAADLLLVEAQDLPAAGAPAATARLHTGIVQVRLGRYAAGLSVLRAALRDLPAPQRVDCRVHMANALIRLDRRADAVRELERAVEQAQDNIDLWVFLARTQADAGQVFEARRTYNAILREFDLDQASRRALEEELRGLG